MRSPAFVIKLGGSVDKAGKLEPWLSTLWAHRAQGLAVVPGGGVFADAVRVRQGVEGFDDSEAHRRALLAMDQNGVRCIERANQLGMNWVAARAPEDFVLAFARQALPVWLPSHWADTAHDLERSWRVTSDTLSLWLAHQLGCLRLVLIKSLDPGTGPRTYARALEGDWIDAAFNEWRQRTHCAVWLLGAGEQAVLAGLLGGDPGGQALLRA